MQFSFRHHKILHVSLMMILNGTNCNKYEMYMLIISFVYTSDFERLPSTFDPRVSFHPEILRATHNTAPYSPFDRIPYFSRNQPHRRSLHLLLSIDLASAPMVDLEGP